MGRMIGERRHKKCKFALNQEERIIRMYRYGLSAELLGKVFLVAPETIVNILKAYGVKIRQPRAKLNLLGCVFDRLTVIAALPYKNNKTWWLCQCSCDAEAVFEVRG